MFICRHIVETILEATAISSVVASEAEGILALKNLSPGTLSPILYYQGTFANVFYQRNLLSDPPFTIGHNFELCFDLRVGTRTVIKSPAIKSPSVASEAEEAVTGLLRPHLPLRLLFLYLLTCKAMALMAIFSTLLCRYMASEHTYSTPARNSDQPFSSVENLT